MLASDGNFFAGKDHACFAGLQAIDEPEFVVQYQGIDQHGLGLGFDDVVGGDGEFLLLQLGRVFAVLLADQLPQPIGLLFKLLCGGLALGEQLVAFWTTGLLALTGGELEAQGNQGIEGGLDGGFDCIQGRALGVTAGAGIAGVIAQFLNFQQFQHLLGFQDSALGQQQIGQTAIGNGHGLGVGFLQLAGQGTQSYPNAFPHIDRLLVENNG